MAPHLIIHAANVPSIFKLESQKINNPKIKANKLYKYFINIGLKLAENIPVSVSFLSSFYVFRTSYLTFNFRCGAAAGYSGICISSVKDCVDDACEPFIKIMNLSYYLALFLLK